MTYRNPNEKPLGYDVRMCQITHRTYAPYSIAERMTYEKPWCKTCRETASHSAFVAENVYRQAHNLQYTKGEPTDQPCHTCGQNLNSQKGTQP